MYNQGVKSAPPLSPWTIVFLPLVFALFFQLSPRSAQVEQDLARARWAEDHAEPAAAASMLARAAGALPWRADLSERAGVDALRAGDAQSALRFFQVAQQRGGLTAQGWLSYGQAYFNTGDSQQATAIWQDLASQSQPPYEVFLRLADAHQSRGELDAAVRDLRAALQAVPGQAEVLFRLGELLLITSPTEALPALLHAAQIDPLLDAHVRLLQAALNRVPADAEPAYHLLLVGRGLGAVDDWDLAREAFLRAVEIRSDYAEAWAFLGEARQQLGQDGLPDLERARQLAPDSVPVQALYAVYWQRQGKPAAAQTHLENAARSEPQNPVWQYELGNLMATAGDLEGAVAHYQQAVELAPNDPDYWRSLAQFSISNRYALDTVGIPAARQVVILAPADPAGYDLLGQAFLVNGDNLTAERFLRQSIEIDSSYALAHLHLGATLLQQGKSEAAYPCFVQAANLAADDWQSEQARRFLERYRSP